MTAARPVRSAPRGETASRATPEAIGRAATLALYDELALSPKPGLVTLVDAGSHTDMDAHTFMRSLLALRAYFVRIAELGAAGAPLRSLEQCGIEAERRMLAATGGVNTHRGAVFMLGLLCAAAGAAAAGGRDLDPATLRETLRARWGADLREKAMRPPTLPGGIAARRHGLRSASQEAAEGFPVLFETALPAMQAASACGLDAQQVHLDTLFASIAVLDDSNLAHRGGLEGLRDAQQAARRFIAEGGSSRHGGIAAAQAIADVFVQRHLSPGGSADVLAASCLVQRLASIGRAAMS